MSGKTDPEKVWEQTDRSSLRKSMDTLFPQQQDGRCRVCNEPVVDGRWNYCSERCREIAQAVQKMFIWDVVREQVLERDNHTCQECGLSYDMAQRAYWQIEERVKELTDPLREQDTGRGVRAYWELRDRYDPPRFTSGAFHVDHITPISEGGHPFDEQNLQTLCRECHREKTAEENSGSDRPAEEVTLDDYLAVDGGESSDKSSTASKRLTGGSKNE